MRTTITLLLAALATAFSILAASPASADQLEVVDETSGLHCPDIDLAEHSTSGGCEVHVVSEHAEPTEWRQHIPMVGEVVFSTCNDEFVAHFNEDGHGFIGEQLLTDPELETCAVEPCDESGDQPHPNIPWRMHLFEFGGQASIVFTFCIRPINPNEEGVEAAQFPCSVTVPTGDENPPNHEYEARTNPFAASSRCSQNSTVSVDAHWQIGLESPNTIEIEHENAP